MRTRYKITIKTHQEKIITFDCETYILREGMVIFNDNRTNMQKAFPVINCEISEVSNE